jgi:hypothetical protein
MSEFFAADLGSDFDAAIATPVVQSHTAQFRNADDALLFARAGKATFTLVSKKTGVRFTFRVSQGTDKETGQKTDTYFVGLLSGPNNEADYSYLGYIRRDVFIAGRRNPKPGDVGPNAPSSKAFAWAWQKLVQGVLPDSLEIWHEGRCGRCARMLTVPSSIESGFGPECAGKI